MLRPLLTVLFAGVSLVSAWAQPARVSNLDDRLQAFLREPDTADGRDALDEAVDEAVQAAVVQRLYQHDVIRAAERLRFDKQAGGSANGGGGTSLVSRALSGGLFSAALESGAFARTTDGTAATVRVNALHTYRLLSGTRPPDCALLFRWCPSDESSPWRGLSVAVSLDASRQDRALPADSDAASALLARTTNTVAAVSVRYELLQRRRYDASAYRTRWDQAIARFAATDEPARAALAMNETAGAILASADYPGFRAAVVSELLAAPRRLEALSSLAMRRAGDRVDRWLEVEPAAGEVSNADRLARAAQALESYRAARDGALRDALFRSALTVDYAWQRPADQPEFSNLRLVAGFPLGSWSDGEGQGTVPVAELTLNAGINVYHRRPAGTGVDHLRDAQVALQIERRLVELQSLGRPVLALAAYYQYMFQNGVIQFTQEPRVPGTPIDLPSGAIELLGTSGPIGIVQLRVSFPLGDSGVTMPLGVTWASRTELLTSREVRGQFGFTFDMDRLLARP
jgi:hypothetical protein